jgi:hypothetical protein
MQDYHHAMANLPQNESPASWKPAIGAICPQARLGGTVKPAHRQGPRASGKTLLVRCFF